MAANTNPIFPLTPNLGTPVAAVTANTTKDGTSGTLYPLFTAGADGARLDYIKARAKGTNVATVLRIFLNNGSTTATAANNSLFMERTIAATGASEVAELADVYVPLDISLPAGWTVFCTIGTAVSAGIQLTAVGGNY